MDKAWTTPPTAVPRADVGRATKSSQGVALPHEFKHRPIQRASLQDRLQPNIALFYLGCVHAVGHIVRRTGVEKGDVLSREGLRGLDRRSAEILLTYTVVRSSLFSECRTTKGDASCKGNVVSNPRESGRLGRPDDDASHARPASSSDPPAAAAHGRERDGPASAARGSRTAAAARSRRAARFSSRCASSTTCRRCAAGASCAPSGRRCASARRVPGSG